MTNYQFEFSIIIEQLVATMQAQNYNWEGVLEFLQKEHQNQALKQNLWFLEKKTLTEQVKELESRVAALENINADLLDRNRMLEYCLRQLKGERAQKEQVDIAERPKIPQRRPKPNKNHVNRILQSLGIPHLIENIQRDLEMKDKGGLNIEAGQPRERDKEIKANKSSVYQPVTTLSGHQDGVKDIRFCDNSDLMVSVSEDCTMKIWKVAGQSGDCLGTIREHSGPIFTLAEGDGHLFTGGMQGIVRCWSLLDVKQKKDVNMRTLVGSWNNSEEDKMEPVWQLMYSPQHKLLLSTSAEISIKAYTINSEGEKVSGKYKRSYVLKESGGYSREEDIPTSICIHNGQLVSGFINRHSLVHFDLESGKVVQDLKFTASGQFVTNRVVSHPKVLIAAYEDKMVRLFDQNKMTYAFKAHEDSVTSVALTANINQFFTCGHDGFVKLWDIRKLDPISSFNAHAKKYDEAIHCIAASQNYSAASGGADSIIKIYSVNH